METLENNKIIAKFMGCDFTQIGKRTLVSPTPTPIGTTYIDKLLYHSDWNWLMEVVEKIESLERVSVVFEVENLIIITIATHNIGEKFKCKQISKQSKSKVEAVYNVCIEFIKWYNQQPK